MYYLVLSPTPLRRSHRSSGCLYRTPPSSPAAPRPPYCMLPSNATHAYNPNPNNYSRTPHTHLLLHPTHSSPYAGPTFTAATQRYFVLEHRELKYYREEIRRSDHGNRGGYHAEPRGAIHLGGGGVRVVTSENTVRTQDHVPVGHGGMSVFVPDAR